MNDKRPVGAHGIQLIQLLHSGFRALGNYGFARLNVVVSSCGEVISRTIAVVIVPPLSA
ncbi:MAG: hypothetical protein ACLTXT_05020 [Ruminococcus callidus]